MREMLLIDISPEKIPDAASWVEHQCYRHGLSKMDGYQVKTCVVEAINNSLEHAYGDGCGKIRIAVWYSEGHVNIEIADFGSVSTKNFDQYESSVDPEEERGRGWLIMKAWMNKASFHRRGESNLVRLAKRIPI